MISADFFTLECHQHGKREGRKGQFWAISYCWIDVFLKEVLGLLAYERSTFKLNLRLYVNFIAVLKYNFLDFFFVCFCLQNLCCNDSEYHSLNWKDVSVTNVDIFGKKQFSLQFFFSLLPVYIAYRVSYPFVPWRIRVFALLTARKGNRTPAIIWCAEIFVSWI